MLPRLRHSGLPNDHLHYAARSEAFRRASKKEQREYMVYRSAMIERGHQSMGFKMWRQA